MRELGVEIWITREEGDVVREGSYVAITDSPQEGARAFLDKMGEERKDITQRANAVDTEIVSVEDGVARVISWLVKQRIELRKREVERKEKEAGEKRKEEKDEAIRDSGVE